jgi:hypothetical protein
MDVFTDSQSNPKKLRGKTVWEIDPPVNGLVTLTMTDGTCVSVDYRSVVEIER